MDPVLSIDPCGLERQETVSTVIPIKRPDEDNHPLKKKKKTWLFIRPLTGYLKQMGEQRYTPRIYILYIK